MGMLDRIDTDLKNAMKGGDKDLSETLKMLKSDITYEKTKTGKDIDDEKIIEVIARAAKRRKESIAEFTKGGRDDLASKEAVELGLIEKYLPVQMSSEELSAFIDEFLKGMPGATKKELGAIMGRLMKDLKGKTDGSAVRTMLSAKLGD